MERKLQRLQFVDAATMVSIDGATLTKSVDGQAQVTEEGKDTEKTKLIFFGKK